EAATRQHGREIAQRDLRDRQVLREARQQCVVRADDGLAVRDRDRRRRGAEATHLLFEGAGCREVLRAGKAVRDHRRFERDDRARSASAIPGTSRSMTRRVASGVTSLGERPVPPLVSTTLAPARTAFRIAVATPPMSSGTSSAWTTA